MSETTNSGPAVVVLGAGVCGLYAGRVLTRSGADVTVLEREDVVGGLAAGRRLGDNYYDLGVHHLHEFDREIFDDIKALMGDALVATPKLALIRYGRGYRRYPLQFADLLLGIPPWTLARALFGLVRQQLGNKLRHHEAQDSEEALIELYGRPLYGFFFRDFTHRYWGVPPSELSATFVRRKMPRLSAVDVVKKALSRFGVKEEQAGAVESALADETLYYGRTGARELPMALAASVEHAGGTVLVSSPVVAVETVGEQVVGVRYEVEGRVRRVECDHCLSTMPITTLVEALEPPPPPDVLSAARALRFRPLVVYGLLVRKPRVLNALYVYYRNRVFHRLAEPGASGLEVHPAGHSLLLAEMTCDLGDDSWTGGDATRRRIVADLEAEGLLAGDDIVEWHLLRSEHGYPVFDLGFETHLEAVERYLDRFTNLYSTGRQGAFTYPNMHGAMRMGIDAATEILTAKHHVYPDGWRHPLLDEGGLTLTDGDQLESGDGADLVAVAEREAKEPT